MRENLYVLLDSFSLIIIKVFWFTRSTLWLWWNCRINNVTNLFRELYCLLLTLLRFSTFSTLTICCGVQSFWLSLSRVNWNWSSMRANGWMNIRVDYSQGTAWSLSNIICFVSGVVLLNHVVNCTLWSYMTNFLLKSLWVKNLSI